jgi:hypothetical protein
MNKYLWAAIALAATLLLAVSVVAGPLTRLPSYQSDSHGVYVQFDNPSQNIDPAHGFPVVGGHMRWEWSALEPFDDVYRFDSTVKAFILGEAEKGKKAAVGFETYVRRNTGSAPYGGVQAIPDWLRSEPVILWNSVDNLYYVTNFLDPTYKAQYADFVYDFADWLARPENAAVLANLAWVEMGVGMESETQPADRWSDATKPDYDYYAEYAPGGEDPPGWTSGDWLRFVNWCTDLYYDAFRVRNPSLASVAIFLNCAPEFQGKDYGSNRDAFSNYAATRGVADGKPGIGLKNNGLQADRSPAGLYGPLERWGSVVATTAVPIGWETYQSWLYDLDTFYWGMLCALDKHPDVIEPTRWLLVDGSYNPLTDYIPVWNWVDSYLGVTPSTTPGIWCALRETETGGEYGNFFFWLYQNDNLSGGKTVALKPGVNSGDAWLMSTGKEGRYARRTDLASGNPYMHFQVLNPSPYYGNPAALTLTVTVTYLDKGTDQWKLRYDSTTGTKDAGVVTKGNTNTWKKAVFVLTDARFGNGYTDDGAGGGNGSGAADLTIDCMDSGDEYIHMVGITRRTEGGPSPTPTQTLTPTPTATPAAATLVGSVTLQRPNHPAPDPSWEVTLTLKIGDMNYPPVRTDSSGIFTITGLTPGTYDICVKNSHTLSTRTTGVVLAAGQNAVSLGTLREGDAETNYTNDFINMRDFNLLASVFFTSDSRADFNQDGIVNMVDFNLLRVNFFAQGDCASFSSQSEGLPPVLVPKE